MSEQSGKNIEKAIESIFETASTLGKVSLMEVCGGHTHTIMKYGLRKLMPENVKLVSGPGCPVCVTSQRDIDSVIELALNGLTVVTYADMLRVPGTRMNLEQARAKGARIKTVYSAEEALAFDDCVFFGIGFETTTPMTAYLLGKGVKVFSSHRKLVPALKALTQKTKVSGFISPGHVSTIIGAKPYRELNVPQVISGFEPEHIITSIEKLLKMLSENDNSVFNNYEQAVEENGNEKALDLIEKNFKEVPMSWRGLGFIPESGYAPCNEELDARIVHADILSRVESFEAKGCRCGEVLQGLIEPKECGLFRTECTPENPIGPCMVSKEGSCGIAFKFKKT